VIGGGRGPYQPPLGSAIVSYEPEAARGTDRKEKRRRGRAYQGRWREGDRDAMLGRSQSPEELPPLGRSPSVQGRAVFLS
jgi:hypothetical protein